MAVLTAVAMTWTLTLVASATAGSGDDSVDQVCNGDGSAFPTPPYQVVIDASGSPSVLRDGVAKTGIEYHFASGEDVALLFDTDDPIQPDASCGVLERYDDGGGFILHVTAKELEAGSCALTLTPAQSTSTVGVVFTIRKKQGCPA